MLRAICNRGTSFVRTSPLVIRPTNMVTNNNVNTNSLMVRQSGSSVVDKPEDHSKHYLYERYVAATMYGIFPAALFIHNPAMDYTLAVVLALHMHWGLHTVATDYARPFVVGDTLAKIASLTIYLLSIATFIGLLNFNYNDVGITRAFEMLFAL